MIDLVVRQYRCFALCIIGGLMLAGVLLAGLFAPCKPLLSGLLVCVPYFAVTTLLYIAMWKKTAQSSPDSLTGFYLAAMAVKLLLGAVVVLAYCLVVSESGKIICFAALFSVYYIAMMVFDAAYFARFEKKNKTYDKQ